MLAWLISELHYLCWATKYCPDKIFTLTMIFLFKRAVVFVEILDMLVRERIEPRKTLQRGLLISREWLDLH